MTEKKLLEALQNLLNAYYPKVIDKKFGGYLSNLTFDLTPKENQEKMIVSQARHIWATSKASYFLNDKSYREFAEHGIDFLESGMWDSENGGYFQIRSRDGKTCGAEGWYDEKRTYGNAFAIYGLASLYKLTNKKKYLDMALKTFSWIEDNAFDNQYGGYFQFFTKENELIEKNSNYKSKATSDGIEIGYKDQNSSIHLLEAYTELFNAYKDDKVKTQLEHLLSLIRDRLTNPKGYLQLFFERDFTPVSFANCSKEEILKNHQLDHVSFGHDYETAFLMLEASYSLQIENDTKTLIVAKRMADHAIANGWDNEFGGFFDEAYYFTPDKCTITEYTKNWWAQAEAMNIYLMLYLIFNDKKYLEIFEKVWSFVQTYLIDENTGDWYWGSIDRQPNYKTGDKASIWKCTYHNARALMNCINMFYYKENIKPLNENQGFLIAETKEFIEHWRTVAKNL